MFQASADIKFYSESGKITSVAVQQHEPLFLNCVFFITWQHPGVDYSLAVWAAGRPYSASQVGGRAGIEEQGQNPLICKTASSKWWSAESVGC